MKINWKALIASVFAVVVVYWAVGLTLPRSYGGSNLSFPVGSGRVTMTNPSNESIPVQLIGESARSFSVSSTSAAAWGASTKQAGGSSATHLFELALPVGVSEFTISRGTNVNFVADTETELEAKVQPLRESETRTTAVVAGVVLLGTLFYISHTTGHQWISRFRRVDASIQAAQPVAVSATGQQVRGYRPYGDNIVNEKE